MNLEFVRDVVGKSKVTGGAVIARPPNGFLLANGIRAMSVQELSECA